MIKKTPNIRWKMLSLLCFLEKKYWVFYKMIGSNIPLDRKKQKWNLFQMYVVSTYTSNSVFEVCCFINIRSFNNFLLHSRVSSLHSEYYSASLSFNITHLFFQVTRQLFFIKMLERIEVWMWPSISYLDSHPSFCS